MKKRRKLAIIVGHEESKQGARVVAPIDTTEYLFNKAFAEDNFYPMAREAGLETVIIYRDKSTISKIGQYVNEWAQGVTTVAIELHLNAFDGKTQGTETLYDIDPSSSKYLAAIIQKKMADTFSRVKGNRGIKLLDGPEDRGYVNLTSVKIPSCIVEPIFADNELEVKLLASLKVPYAKCLVEGVIEFFETKGL